VNSPIDLPAELRRIAGRADEPGQFDHDRISRIALRAAAAEIERLTLVWTTERPTVAGRYLREQPDGECVVWEITPYTVDYLALGGYPGGRWAGPIPEPREPRNTETPGTRATRTDASGTLPTASM
jgi:hypothetical protein